jgi:glucosamine-6-phosphate deaminase
MRVLVAPDYGTLSHTAAQLVLNAIRHKPDLRLGLPTGNTPLGMYEEMVKAYREQQLDFTRLRTFNLDEYLDLPKDHPRTFHSYMQKHFFDHVNIPAGNIHIPDGSPGYENAIQAAGGIDLLIVGIAANGHIAFNEPGSALDSRTREVDLAPETVAHAQESFGSEPAPTRAITMGIGTILEAHRIVLLASGASKADAVERALHGPVSTSVPASALQMHQRVVVVVDEAASKSGV